MSQRTCSKCGQRLAPGALRCPNGHFQKTTAKRRPESASAPEKTAETVELECLRCQILFAVEPIRGDICVECPKCHREISLLGSERQRTKISDQQRRSFQRYCEEESRKTTVGWQVMSISQAIHAALFAVASFWTVEAFARGMSELWRSLGPLGPGGHLQMLAGTTMMSCGVFVVFLFLTGIVAWGAYALWGIETYGRTISILSQVLLDVPLACWAASALSGRFDEALIAAPFLSLVATYLLVGSDEIEITPNRFYAGITTLVTAHVALLTGVLSAWV